MSRNLAIFVALVVCQLVCSVCPTSAVEPLRYELKAGDVLHYQIVVQIETPTTNDTLGGMSKYTVLKSDDEGTTLEFVGGLGSASVDKKDETKRFSLTRWNLGHDVFGEKKATIRIAKNGVLVQVSGESHLPLGLGNLYTLPFEAFPEDDRQSWTSSSGTIMLSNAETTTMGKERVDYKIIQDGKKVSIDRKYSLTTPKVENSRYIRTEDKGQITFNRDLGSIDILFSEQRVIAEMDNVQITFPIKLTVYRMTEDEIAAHEKLHAEAKAKRELERTKYIRAIDPEDKKKSMAILRSDDWRATYRLLVDMRRSVRKELLPVDVDVAVQIGLLRGHAQPEVRAAADIIWNKWGAAVEKHGTDQQKSDVSAAVRAGKKLNEEMVAKSNDVQSSRATAIPTVDSRTWTNRQGRPLAVGSFVRMDRNRVVLRTSEGKEVKFPLAVLSREDQTMIEQLAAKASTR
ncbi:hypothetical protein [Aporhodopirellula aestuarii]|uniref:SLA1 homology domain-containing protein n=1 Tax=Aporhodopirellula aestuarii TaxID=2950107 RepID=A0ABT0UD44_9BACT|nr:hypothetical protein [Aporhodopirellula aestuarii]MCM2374952.1 hypothetical protein [Aporhodopirellula aestuarii]